MPGRNFSAGSYRYGFNGKENDPETVGTDEGTQDYGMRIYNPALGKFLSVDPLFKSFAYKTPYDFAENTPIMCIDLDGGQSEFFALAKMGYFGSAAQTVARDIDKGATKSAKKFAHGVEQSFRLVNGQATHTEYVNAVVGIIAQTLYVQTPGVHKVIANELAKSKNVNSRAVGNTMKALDKEAADNNKAFKEGNTEKIAEVITDVGILVTTFVVSERINAYSAPADAVIVADEVIVEIEEVAGGVIGDITKGNLEFNFNAILEPEGTNLNFGKMDIAPREYTLQEMNLEEAHEAYSNTFSSEEIYSSMEKFKQFAKDKGYKTISFEGTRRTGAGEVRKFRTKNIDVE